MQRPKNLFKFKIIEKFSSAYLKNTLFPRCLKKLKIWQTLSGQQFVNLAVEEFTWSKKYIVIQKEKDALFRGKSQVAPSSL